MDRTEIPKIRVDTRPSNGSEQVQGQIGEGILTPLPDALSDPTTSGTGAATGATRAPEKRRSPRFKCEGSVEFFTEGGDARTWATITDISLTGCFVEVTATSAVNTAVNMVVDVQGVSVRVKGIVKIFYPLLGMGIEFTDLSELERGALEGLLRRLAGETLPQSETTLIHSSMAASEPLMIMDTYAAINAVAKFFKTNQTLTKEHFTELIGKSQKQR